MKVDQIATAPVSWGIWFPDDEKQMDWKRCIQEMHAAGFRAMELGPWGYFPTEYVTLKEVFSSYDMTLIATTLMVDLTTKENFANIRTQLDEMAQLQTKFSEAKYVVLIDDVYTDLFTGKQIRKGYLTEEDRAVFYENVKSIHVYAKERYGLKVVFHPHAQTHVETVEQIEELLQKTDINLCFDTGHHALMGEDVEQFIERYFDRIAYIHLKNCNREKVTLMEENNWSLAKAVREGVMEEPHNGLIDMNYLLKLLKKKGYAGWLVVEQDMYPAPFDKPLPIAQRTFQYLKRMIES